jgi:hypothetical protein
VWLPLYVGDAEVAFALAGVACAAIAAVVITLCGGIRAVALSAADRARAAAATRQ